LDAPQHRLNKFISAFGFQQQLKDNQLRYVYKLLNGNFSLPQIQTLCLFKWAKMKVKRREGSLFIVKYNRLRSSESKGKLAWLCQVGTKSCEAKQVFPVSALQITEAIQAMNWLGDFPVYPVRLSRIGLHRPLPADFQDETAPSGDADDSDG